MIDVIYQFKPEEESGSRRYRGSTAKVSMQDEPESGNGNLYVEDPVKATSQSFRLSKTGEQSNSQRILKSIESENRQKGIKSLIKFHLDNSEDKLNQDL